VRALALAVVSQKIIFLSQLVCRGGGFPYGLGGLVIRPACATKREGFHESFCADIRPDDAAFYAISQRPLAGVALTEAAPTSAWRSRPVWAVLPTADRRIDPGVHRFSYERMQAQITEVEGASHVVMISHPRTLRKSSRRPSTPAPRRPPETA
jgi:hypothetical protein